MYDLSGSFGSEPPNNGEMIYKRSRQTEENREGMCGCSKSIKNQKVGKKQSTSDPAPPPRFTPENRTWQNGAKGILNCLYRHTYIWQYNGMSYWFFPADIKKGKISGQIWTRQRWSEHAVNIQSIRAHQCFYAK